MPKVKSEDHTKRPITVVERRLASGSIFTVGSRSIPLREPDRWELRIVNGQISDAHVWELQAEKGWVYLEPGDLAVKAEEIGFRVHAGRVVRGTHGHEVIMKMPKSDYQQIVALKDAENRKHTFGDKANKAAIVAAASQLPDGGQAAEFLNRAVSGVQIKDTLERVSLEP